MRLQTERYRDQVPRWPAAGRHILAHTDPESIIVYQAYRPAIGDYALRHQVLGGPDFSYGRMSWIKPNFLWMMYRSSWGTATGQEVVLGLRIPLPFFDTLCAQAVSSRFDGAGTQSRDQWQAAVKHSDVRLQWDPDHDPSGAPQARRAIQLGLRGDALAEFGQRTLMEVIDLSPFVAEQRQVLQDHPDDLLLPVERVYCPSPAAAANLGLDPIAA